MRSLLLLALGIGFSIAQPLAAQTVSIVNAQAGSGANCRVISITARVAADGPFTGLTAQNFRILEGQSTVGLAVSSAVFNASTGNYALTYTTASTATSLSLRVSVVAPGASFPPSSFTTVNFQCGPAITVNGTFTCPNGDVQLNVTVGVSSTILPASAFTVREAGITVPVTFTAPSSATGIYILRYRTTRTTQFSVNVSVQLGEASVSENATINATPCARNIDVETTYVCATREVTLSVSISPAPATVLPASAFRISEAGQTSFTPASFGAPSNPGGPYILRYTTSRTATFGVQVQVTIDNTTSNGTRNVIIDCATNVTASALIDCATRVVTVTVNLNPPPSAVLSAAAFRLTEPGGSAFAATQFGGPTSPGGPYILRYTTTRTQNFALQIQVEVNGLTIPVTAPVAVQCTSSLTVSGSLDCGTRQVTLNVIITPAATTVSDFRIRENGGTEFVPNNVTPTGTGSYQLRYTTNLTQNFEVTVRAIPGGDQSPFLNTAIIQSNCQLSLTIDNVTQDCAQSQFRVIFTLRGIQNSGPLDAPPFSSFTITENGTPVASQDIILPTLTAAPPNSATYTLVYRSRVQTTARFVFGITANVSGRTAEVTRELDSCLTPAPSASCSTAPANVTVNQSFTFTPTVTGGIAPLQWNYVAQQTDLAALTAAPVVVAASGQTTATFRQAGTFRITLRVLDAINRNSDTTCTFTVQTGAPSLSVTCGELATITGRVGQSYSARATASGGVPAYTWSIADTTNTFAINQQGVVTGNPNQVRAYPVSITVRDSATPAVQQSASCSITVQAAIPPAPVPTCSGITGSTAVVGQLYTATPAVNANTGVAPFTWSFLPPPAPPAWLTVRNAANGQIGGTPPTGTAAGPVSIRLQVQDSASPARTANVTCSFNVTQPAPVITPSLSVTATPTTTTNAVARVALAAPAPVALRGQLRITFTPAQGTGIASAETPNPSFVNGLAADRKQLNFDVPVGQSNFDFPIQQGTVAGTVSVQLFSLDNAATNTSVLTSTVPTQTFTIAASRPVITAGSVSLEANAPAGCTAVAGASYVFVKAAHSTTRQITGGRITFALVPGRTADGSLDIELESVNGFAQSFQTWFGSPLGKQAGSSFGFCLPVNLTNGGIADIQNVTVRLRNALTPGESDPVSWR